MASAAISLDALRARVRELEGAHTRTRREPTGLSEVDDSLGGLPRPGLVELFGTDGSGRTRLALALVAARTRRRENVAWADLSHDLYPPAFAQHGVVARRVLVVRPSHDRAEWAAEQLIRSGCFSLVVVSGLAASHRAGPRLAHAAEQGHATVLVVGTAPDKRLPATLRLAVGDDRAVVLRDRSGVPGRSTSIPAWPVDACPW
jgi:RecA/RadA recombinase